MKNPEQGKRVDWAGGDDPAHWSVPFPEQVRIAWETAERAETGNDLPHPQQEANVYHAMNAALKRRGLRLSLFLRVIEGKAIA